MSFTGRASAPHGGIVAFQWFFGDGRTASGRRVSHTFKTPGTFRVRLRATDSWGNWAYAGRTIRVKRLSAG
jgi:PKD repeat protein